MKEYRVYYLGTFCTSFDKRDDALDYVVSQVDEIPRADFGDFEILDRSDEL